MTEELNRLKTEGFFANLSGKLVSVWRAPLGIPVVIASNPLSDLKLDAYALEYVIPEIVIESNSGVDAYFLPLIDPTTLPLKLSNTIQIILVSEVKGFNKFV